MKKILLFVTVLSFFCLSSCDKSDGASSGGAKSAVSLMDKVIGKEISSAKKTVESFGIPFWEKNSHWEYDWEYIFDNGESDEPSDLVRLFVSYDIVQKSTYETKYEDNKATCDNILITWAKQLNYHKIGEYIVLFKYAENNQGKMNDFSQLSDFIKNSNTCNVYFDVESDYDMVGHITINKAYEDMYWGGKLIYEW